MNSRYRRYRELVSRAEENYRAHQVLYGQVQELAQTGLGTGYDLVSGPRTISLLASVDYRPGRIDVFEEGLADPEGPGSDLLLAVERQTVDSLTTELAAQWMYVYPWRGFVAQRTGRRGIREQHIDAGFRFEF